MTTDRLLSAKDKIVSAARQFYAEREVGFPEGADHEARERAIKGAELALIEAVHEHEEILSDRGIDRAIKDRRWQLQHGKES